MKIAIIDPNERIVLPPAAGSEAISSIYPLADIEWIRLQEPPPCEEYPGTELYIDLDFKMDPVRIVRLAGLLPVPVMVDAVTHTLGDIGQPFVRINAWPGFLERGLHELVMPDDEISLQIDLLYQKLGKEYKKVPDIAGMISPRIIAAIINEAFYALQENVSTVANIDTAMKLGTNYPFGPFEWCERIGAANVCELLNVLSKTENRYNPAEALRTAAAEIKMELKSN